MWVNKGMVMFLRKGIRMVDTGGRESGSGR